LSASIAARAADGRVFVSDIRSSFPAMIGLSADLARARAKGKIDQEQTIDILTFHFK
jgi:hypothetical protein